MDAETKTKRIKDALLRLDPENDDHWKTNGRPQVAVVIQFAKTVVTKGEIDEIDPHLTRETSKQRAEAEVAALVGGQGELPQPGPDAAALPKPKYTSVLERPTHEVMNSLPLLRETITALNEAAVEQHQIRTAADEELQRISRLSQIALRQIQRLEALNPEKKDDPIRAYIKAANAERAAKAERAKRVLGLTGINTRELMKQTEHRSPLDRAMNVRGPQRGGSRPVPRVPVSN